MGIGRADDIGSARQVRTTAGVGVAGANPLRREVRAGILTGSRLGAARHRQAPDGMSIRLTSLRIRSSELTCRTSALR